MPSKTKTACKPCDNEDDSKRWFKASDQKIDNGEFFGRFSGKTPGQAASKAFTSIVKTRADKKVSAKGKIPYEIREITRGGSHKSYHYVGEREKLCPPVERTINGKTFLNEYKNKIKADKSAKSDSESK